ncbi:hypothetical protein DSM104443_03751 [Usitatibacter rugosus]|uniref:Secreted protein n=1 Tax=Usitatibacter rugosus TaxID=2732067 RepID=A0A6M4GZH9_9PROT|nr:hypothetical protein [Usitatibacter rugosus]QJR12659.1 hypothetical protein DSM104443_03751 [Usitatibacter rugosus]
MRISAYALLAIAFPLAASAETRQPTEAQCRQLVGQMVQTMRTTPPPAQRDKDADALLARVEKTVQENRAARKSECDSWAYIVNAVTKN